MTMKQTASEAKTLQPTTNSLAVWYLLWSAMLFIASCNALVPYTVLSSNIGFVVSALLAAMATIQLCRRENFLNQKEKGLAAVVLILFAVSQFLQWVGELGTRSVYRGFDFSAYYLAAKVVSEAPGSSLYYLPLYPDGRMDLHAPAPLHSAWQVAALSNHVPFFAPFIYPPFFAVIMKPFARFSFATSFSIWEIITVLLLFGAVLFTLNMASTRLSLYLSLILGVGLFSYFPLRAGLFMGQIGCLIFLLLAVGVWLLSRGQESLSALCFAVGTMIKLTPVLAVPLLIFHRRWRWLAAYIAWMSSLLIVSVSQTGWAVHKQFWREVLPAMSCGSPIGQNDSVGAYVQELFLGFVPDWKNMPQSLPLYACTTSQFVAATVYALMLVRFYLRRRDGELVRDMVIMALFGIVISPIGWWHHFTIALLPFLYLWCKMPKKGDPVLLALFVIVGTNFIGFGPLLVENHAVQLVLAAIVPSLTIALVYRYLAPDRKSSISYST